MRFLISLILVGFVIAGCSSPSQMNSAASEPSENTNSPVNSSGDPFQKATASQDSASSAPLAVTVRPPSIYVGPAQGTPPADVPTPPAVEPGDWQTFTSPDLGVSVDYPSSWSVDYRDRTATFTSLQGQSIRLQVAEAGNRQDCATLINSHGLSVDACVDTSTFTYSAKFSVESKDGSSSQLMLSTTGQAALEVYNQMLDSLRPTP